ncbi:hypothetical protein [Nesterenkonia sp.]|uniref:hypothetical protein n=1 Tax=Nesterenkonia sp. TaxID=704201 RepID=UPI002638099B|nr:hypothetical protein [Nesterenkonia sp.]
MSQRPGSMDHAAERLLLSGVEQADERERAVSMEAEAFGMQCTVLACWVGALVCAVLGQITAAAALVLVPVIPGCASLWYASRRGVNSYALLARAPLTQTLGRSLFFSVLLALTVAALVYRVYYGVPLVDFHLHVEVVGEDLRRVMALLAVLGAAVGVLVSMLWLSIVVWVQRAAERRGATKDEDDDDDVDWHPTGRWRTGLLACAVVTLLAAQVPWILGGRDGFAVVVALGGLIYAAALLGIWWAAGRRRARGRR